MKIGITCYPTHGGSGVVASELGLALSKRGHEVHIISYATPFRLGGFHENLFIHEVEVASYPLFRYPPYALSLATKIVDVHEEVGLDIIHSHYAVPHAASAYLAKQVLRSKRLKTITTLHGTDITLVGVDKSFYKVIQFAIEESDGVTAVSHYLRRRTIDEFSLTKEIRVIHNFVDTERFRPGRNNCVRDRFAEADEKIVLHASNFRPVKRVGDVVRAFEKIRQQVPSKLLLVGEGPERLFIQQLVKELKLSPYVVFLGQQDYIEEFLGCADLFFQPSEQESFGLAALEAHSCAIPVIGTDVGGMREAVKEGETGYLLPVGDIAGMAEKGIAILQDERLAERLSMEARAMAVHTFDTSQIVPVYEAFYEEVMASA
ncbi:MAG: N-acetyl-alpha-D-glucosaminyl L-malate synthase BshA [Acidobacteriota bacterium]|nr:MAG: N-acetyl-alpha-D-glucosaminyl L-malate synthase BshA [Acidobacteriota bacterium]